MENDREHGTSIVEYFAIQRIDAEERYKQHVADIEERRKKRLSFSIEGDTMYVTYQDLIQIGILIVALANLIYQIAKGKKK